MKILQLTHRLPYPANDGGKIGIFNFTKNFTNLSHDVTLISIGSIYEKNIELHGLKSQVKELKVFYKDVTNKKLDVIKNSIFSILPYNMNKYIFNDIEIFILDLMKNNNFDIVHIDHLHMAYYGRQIKKLYPSIPIVLREHNVEYTILERVAKNEKNILKKILFSVQSKKLKEYEENIIKEFDKILVITQEDYKKLENIIFKRKLEIVPAGVDIDNFPRIIDKYENKNKNIVSIGSMDWIPNQDGLAWFIENVMPLLVKKYPEIKLFIAGRGTPIWFKKKYENEFITFLGFVEDADSLIKNSSLAIVPLFAGGGMRVKILNYFAWGIPTISTTIGAEGIEVHNEEDILIADNITTFITAIETLFNNHLLYNKISENAYNNICSNYSWKQIINKTLTIYSELTK